MLGSDEPFPFEMVPSLGTFVHFRRGSPTKSVSVLKKPTPQTHLPQKSGFNKALFLGGVGVG